MAYSRNRRCGPGSGIRHAPLLAPRFPKLTAEEIAANIAERRRLRNQLHASNRDCTTHRQIEAAEAFAEHLSTPGYDVGERKRLGITGNPKKGGIGHSKRKRRKKARALFSGCFQPRKRKFAKLAGTA